MRALQGRAKERREAGVFVTEGVRLAEEALAHGWDIEMALYAEGLNERGRKVVEELWKRGVQVEEASQDVMKAASGTQTPQGLVLVVGMKQLPVPEQLHFVLALDQVRDPGNLGAILRSAAAAGVQAVYLTPETAEAFAPKVVRAGMGAHFRLPVRELNWEKIETHLKNNALNLYVATAEGGEVYTRADLRQPLALIVGGEASGAGEYARRFAKPLRIPMPGGGESLNAAMAASILLFEVVRQRGAEKA